MCKKGDVAERGLLFALTSKKQSQDQQPIAQMRTLRPRVGTRLWSRQGEGSQLTRRSGCLAGLRGGDADAAGSKRSRTGSSSFGSRGPGQGGGAWFSSPAAAAAAGGRGPGEGAAQRGRCRAAPGPPLRPPLGWWPPRVPAAPPSRALSPAPDCPLGDDSGVGARDPPARRA